jgi:predicted esterase
MTRTLSQLPYSRIQDIQASPRILTLHRHNDLPDSLADLARAIAPDARIIGMQSFKGVYVGRDIVGYTWYIGPMDRPAPVFFGDSLAEIERFLWDEMDRQGTDNPERPYLLGVEQGAVMAIASALAVPDMLSGVIAIDGALPVVPGWNPPLAPLSGLPVLMIGDLTKKSDAPVLRREELSQRLTEWGGNVTLSDSADEADRIRVAVEWLAQQSPRYGYPPETS